MAREAPRDTRSAAYAEYLASRRGLRRFIDVQLPYRWNIRRMDLRKTLDLGCGTGRHLANLDGGSVGIDHNAHAVEYCRDLGLTAYLPEEFARSRPCLREFDSLLIAHVFEHMPYERAGELLRSYVPYLRQGGRAVVITPQEAGFRSDATHVHFCDAAANEGLLRTCGFEIERSYSFPFPRLAGRAFVHNEFVTVGRLRPTPERRTERESPV